MQAQVHALLANLERKVLTPRQRLGRAKAALLEDHGGERELVEDGGGREAEGHRCFVARVVEAAVVDSDRPYAPKSVGRAARQDVHDAGRASHAENREKAEPAELLVVGELGPSGVEQASEVEIVTAGAKSGFHHPEVEGVGGTVDDGRRARRAQPGRQGLGVAGIGGVDPRSRGSVAPGHARGRGKVRIEEQDRMSGAREVEHGRATHGARATQDGDQTFRAR